MVKLIFLSRDSTECAEKSLAENTTNNMIGLSFSRHSQVSFTHLFLNTCSKPILQTMWTQTWSRGYKTFSCSTQLSIFQMPIKTEISTNEEVSCSKSLEWCIYHSGVEPRGGGVLWYFHTYVGSGYFWVQNSEFQYFWGFWEKCIFLGGMKILWIFFGGSSQNWASLRVISKHFRVFF